MIQSEIHLQPCAMDSTVVFERGIGSLPNPGALPAAPALFKTIKAAEKGIGHVEHNCEDAPAFTSG